MKKKLPMVNLAISKNNQVHNRATVTVGRSDSSVSAEKVNLQCIYTTRYHTVRVFNSPLCICNAARILTSL